MAKWLTYYMRVKTAQKSGRHQSSSLICISSTSSLSRQPDQGFKTWSSEAVNFKNKLQSSLADQWNRMYAQYEEFVGLKDVQLAQQEVKQAEKAFLGVRTDERSTMREVLTVRDKLKHVRERLSHVDYSNPLYPQLANEQHELVTLEEKMQKELDAIEEKERDSFLELSAAMRDSYEKERARVERTKNWSLIGTVVGTIIGMLGSVYINRVRTKDLKQMILDQHQNEELKESIDQVIPHTQSQYSDIKEEIKQLQICLINKLLDPPGNRSDVTNAVEIKPHSTGGNDATLESLAKILQSFQAQLHHLIEKSSQSQVAIKTQTDDLYKEVVELKTTKKMDSAVLEEITKINFKLEAIRKRLKSSEEIKDLKESDENSDSDKTNNYIREFVITGTILSALYYIFSV